MALAQLWPAAAGHGRRESTRRAGDLWTRERIPSPGAVAARAYADAMVEELRSPSFDDAATVRQVQIETSHELGQNFVHAFTIRFSYHDAQLRAGLADLLALVGRQPR